MLDKIVLSKDRKNARVYFDTHSVGFYHSEGKVEELIFEIVFAPGIRLQERIEENKLRLISSLEDTQEIDLQLSFKDVA